MIAQAIALPVPELPSPLADRQVIGLPPRLVLSRHSLRARVDNDRTYY